MASRVVLLTGATGVLGSQVARRLLQDPHTHLVALVRGRDREDARRRLEREWWYLPELRSVDPSRVEVLCGDITQPRLGLSDEQYHGLTVSLTHIIHAAADVRLFAPLEELRRINVEGTRHLLELAHAVQDHHGLTRLAHLSTAYVCGNRSDEVAEEELSDRYGFSSPYEQSKYEAEILVREAMTRLPVSVFRPGMIVGDGHTGAIKTFNTLYYPLRLYMTGNLRVAPASPTLRVNLVPVDFVADAVVRLLEHPQAVGRTFHLTPPPDAMPTLGEMVAFVREWTAEHLGIRLPQPLYLPLHQLIRPSAALETLLKDDLASLMRLLPYFQKQPIFRRDAVQALLGDYPYRDWRAFLPHLLAYAVRYSFWHRSGRTVYEQVLFRLQSRRKPVVYHDLPASGGRGKLVEQVRSAAEVRQEILTGAAALQALGMQPGERVAILGRNTSRYFSLLIACGLAGVVSVPLYVTCPPAEISRLLEDSGARIFFVGDEAALAKLHHVRFHGLIVDFTLRQEGKSPLTDGLDWESFLQKGAGHSFQPPTLSMDDPAALYYTSGTTGHARGVLYRQGQLRWVAETLASMYPWKERNRWGSYLSFLPLSHVVEGILATFSPYFVPAALDLYYLQDFNDLPLGLRMAEPTIFFSVPRFFEKLHQAVLETSLGKRYLSLPPGRLRRGVGKVLRWGLLRKAGLRGCRQMIVGSARSDPSLLAFFRELGIEVHDAYGLTEAPLVSMNRLGRNRLGTVGELLPETEVRRDAEGVLYVRGPQVADGYHTGGRFIPFPEGWLDTGDMGELSADGFLSLQGRKKDLLVTSYGKKIYPAAIEAQLRMLPGVAQVMLVGESKPYCAALFWLEEPCWNEDKTRLYEKEIARINAQFSHPEQVKRWAVLRDTLTIEDGSLTSSMKLRRPIVNQRYAAVIEALYRGEQTEDMLYLSPFFSAGG
ncbi:AMP-binding protein [Anaerolinea thermophila]|uniref:AMP-binding protein n=4 Tax=Anaerolinea TaxID=233189 RepID=UPI0026F22E2C|nr:AMP-binding protein [Anaerolinea thermophila]